MATIASDLFVRYLPGDSLDPAHNRLLYNQLGGTPAIPALTAGDTIDFSTYFLDAHADPVPFKYHRYEGATVKVRLRAAGNATIYANATASAEITPSVGVAVTRLQAGTTAQVEIQRFIFNSLPVTGSFQINFTKPSSHNSSGAGSRPGLSGSTAPIPVTASAGDVLNAMLNVNGFFRYDTGGNLKEGPMTFAEYVASFGEGGRTPVITKLANGFTIQFGTVTGGNLNSWIDLLPLITVTVTDVQNAYGWTVSLPLTHGSFADLFNSGNGPAFLEVLLTPSGEGEVIAAQYQLTTPLGDDGDPPDPAPGSGGPPGNLGGVIYDGDHFAFPWPIGVLRSETPFAQAPGYHILRQRYRWARSSFTVLPLDTPCPKDGRAILVEETERMDVGGADLLEWERVWAHIPPTLTDFEVINYTWQILGTLNGANVVASFPLTVTAKITRTFHYTHNPAALGMDRLPRVAVYAGVVYIFNNFTNIANGQTVIARDDTLVRWMGNIWMKTHATFVHNIQ